MLSDRRPRPERPGAKSDNMPASSARSTVSAPPQASATPSDKTPHGRTLTADTIDHSTVVSAPVTANMPTSAVTNTDTQQQKNNIRHTYTHTRKET